MSFFNKIKMKNKYDLLICNVFLRVEKNKNDNVQYICKKIDGVDLVLCFEENGKTVNIKKEKVEEMLSVIGSNEYKYSIERLFDTAALNTMSIISKIKMRLNPEQTEILLDKNKNSNLLMFTEIENPNPAALIYAKPYFINRGDTNIEKFLPNLNCPKLTRNFQGRTIFAIPKPNLIFYGDFSIESIKEEIVEHIKKYTKGTYLLSNKYYTYDENYNIMSIGEFNL